MIVAQVRAVADDLGVDAVKVGMLGDEPTIEAVVRALDLVGDVPVVVDPVMLSQSGAVLLDPNAKAALIESILPRATVATPNLPEARELSGLGERAGAEQLAVAIQALGPEAVIVTGGHAEDGADLLFDGSGIASNRRPTLRRRGLARIGLHPFVGAGRLPRPGHRARRGSQVGARDRGRGGRQRPARARRGTRPGRCVRAGRRHTLARGSPRLRAPSSAGPLA